MGKLYYGDNLRILKEKIPDESIDLIYPGHPFDSNADYEVFLKVEIRESKDRNGFSLEFT